MRALLLVLLATALACEPPVDEQGRVTTKTMAEHGVTVEVIPTYALGLLSGDHLEPAQVVAARGGEPPAPIQQAQTKYTRVELYRIEDAASWAAVVARLDPESPARKAEIDWSTQVLLLIRKVGRGEPFDLVELTKIPEDKGGGVCLYVVPYHPLLTRGNFQLATQRVIAVAKDKPIELKVTNPIH